MACRRPQRVYLSRWHRAPYTCLPSKRQQGGSHHGHHERTGRQGRLGAASLRRRRPAPGVAAAEGTAAGRARTAVAAGLGASRQARQGAVLGLDDRALVLPGAVGRAGSGPCAAPSGAKRCRTCAARLAPADGGAARPVQGASLVVGSAPPRQPPDAGRGRPRARADAVLRHADPRHARGGPGAPAPAAEVRGRTGAADGRGARGAELRGLAQPRAVARRLPPCGDLSRADGLRGVEDADSSQLRGRPFASRLPPPVVSRGDRRDLRSRHQPGLHEKRPPEVDSHRQRFGDDGRRGPGRAARPRRAAAPDARPKSLSKRKAGSLVRPGRGPPDGDARERRDADAAGVERRDRHLGGARISPPRAPRDGRHAAQARDRKRGRLAAVPGQRGTAGGLPHQGAAEGAALRWHGDGGEGALPAAAAVAPPARGRPARRPLGPLGHRHGRRSDRGPHLHPPSG